VPTGAYRRLNPATKLALALAEAVLALGVRGWSGPLVVIAVCVGVTIAARIARRSVLLVLASIPLLLSIVLVNTFLYPGATDPIVQLGPVRPTWTGLAAAVQATLRVVAFGFSVVVLILTTEPDHLIADLERRGLGRRAAFVVGATLRAIPRTTQRAGQITEAQRARALDTEGRLWRRVRGILPLAGPLVFGALTDVEEQTMALEARAFSAPGRRTVLRVFPDSATQRVVRWAALLGALALLASSIAGVLEAIP